jgi:hypothetical protein
MIKNIGVLLVVILVGLLIIFGPFITIWAMNTLFPVLAIPYTFDTWCALVLISLYIKGNVSYQK